MGLRRVHAFLLLGLFVVVGCSSLEPATDGPALTGPGASALDRDDPTCKVDADCATGEQCSEGLCQMQRCGAQGYASAPPLGARSYFAVDRELLVVSDDATKRTLDGYEPTDGSFAHPAALSFALNGRRIVDATGGNFDGRRPESIAAVAEGSTKLFVVSGTARSEIELGFTPVAASTGDLEADGVDEVIVLGRDGNVAICSAVKKTCERRAIPSVLGKDIVAADVDGDGKDEPVILADLPSGESAILVMNVDGAKTGQPELVRLATGKTLVRIAAGDLDGKGPAEIVGLEDGGYADLRGDTLRFYGQRDGKIGQLGETSIAGDAVDVHIGDIEGDGRREVLVLEKSGLEVFTASSATAIKSSYKTALTASKRASRITMADLDGDSPSGSLVGDRTLVPGPVVPLSVLVYPPYSRTASDGTAQIGLGSRDTKAEVAASTITLKASLSMGFEANFPGIAKVALQGKVEAQVARTLADGRSVSIGDGFTVDARPELEGPDNGVAVLASACYHAYTYRIEDPGGRLGDRAGNGKLMSLFVPVGGQTSLWSLKRYNALAKRTSNLPVIQVPYVVGDPKSYPKSMTKLDGTPVPTSDLLFTAPRSYRTSDVARVSWDLKVGETTATTDSRTIGVSVRGTLRAGPVSVEGEVGASRNESYTVTVGREATFSGTVPPVRNIASTPEDENALYGYGFAPVVYRERYTTKDGKQGGFYVVTYTVQP